MVESQNALINKHNENVNLKHLYTTTVFSSSGRNLHLFNFTAGAKESAGERRNSTEKAVPEDVKKSVLVGVENKAYQQDQMPSEKTGDLPMPESWREMKLINP